MNTFSEQSRRDGATLRLIIVSDSSERLGRLKSLLSRSAVEIVGKSLLEELNDINDGAYDMAVIDVDASLLVEMLKAFRANIKTREISILVEASRLSGAPNFCGVLSKYRAMPCSMADLVTLVQHRITNSCSG